SKSVDISEVLDRSSISAFQIGIFILCGLCLIMDGFDVQALGPIAPAIIQDWHVPMAQMGPALSAALLGILVGSIVFSMVADKIGRRPVLIFATLFFSVVTLMTARVNTIPDLRTIRFFAGMGLGGIMPNAVALVGEYSPRRLRVLLMIVVTNGFNVGAAMAGLISAWMIPAFGWRSVFLVGGAIPAVIGTLMLAFLPESLQFLALRGKASEKLAKSIRRIDPAAAVDAETTYVVHEQKSGGVPILHLFTEGRAVGTTLLWIINFMNLLNLYFLASWLPTVVNAAFGSVRTGALVATTLQVGGVVGTFVFSWLVERIGFIPVLGTAFTTACIAIALIGQPALSLAILFGVVFVAGFCVVGGQGAVNALAATYYPTNLRSTGVGSGLGVGRIGGIAGPSIAGLLLGIGWMPRDLFYAAAIPALVSAITMFSLRWVMRPQENSSIPKSEVLAH
ncbi:MAG TPA: MFS transporter, partial [Terriglobia bacterium]|nr:MFS transporter [Terriglobia bacterium]